ncbi:uncharacterized protein IL334_007788 [Kwoniella shivajii]|uniref:Bromo domain-containing protein n=1 Tax=Kwoniella shivajii TaxID=564305 RepID=A0ABZ1DBW7_9TREE|nr:hypothetical protein IL334_007788 [Kwoniella shivajii]
MPPRKASGSRQRTGQNALPIPTIYPDLIDGKGMNEDQWQGCKEMLETVYKAKDGSRKMSDIFRELPDRDEYEDYYQAIPEPECLDNISTQLGQQTYANPEAFYKQLHLVFLNAKHYNEDESLLWADAKQLEELILSEWKTRAQAGIFSSVDPYHKSVKPIRKKRGPSSMPSKSSTPLPEIKTAPSPVPEITPLPPAPEPELPPISEMTIAAPSPTPISAPTPTVRATITIPSSVARNLQGPTQPASPTPSERGRQSQAEKDRKITAALDATLPRWSGPSATLPGDPPGGLSGCGWFGEGAPDYERSAGGPAMWPHRIRAVAGAVAGYKDVNGTRLSEVLDILPAMADIPYLSFNTSISFAGIQATARVGRYATLRDFDMDMWRLFEKARRYFHDGSIEYGNVLILQRLYNALTATYPMALPASGIPAPSPTLFASLPAGPGNARSMHETAQDLKAGAAEDQVGFGITTFRVGTKDRKFTDEARHKGMSFKTELIMLLSVGISDLNKRFTPPTRCSMNERSSRPVTSVTTLWKTYWKRYLSNFTSSTYVVNLVLESITQAGRAMSVTPDLMIENTSWLGSRTGTAAFLISPFLQGVQGPGFFGEPRKGTAGDEDDDDDDEKEKDRERSKRRERARREVQPPPAIDIPPVRKSPIPTPIPAPIHSSGPSRSAMPSTPTPQGQSQPVYRPPVPSSHPSAPVPSYLFPNRTIVAAMGGHQALDQSAVKEALPSDTTRLFERDARGHVLWFSGPPLAPGTIPVPQQQAHSLEYLTYIIKRKRGEEAIPQKRIRRDVEESPENDADGPLYDKDPNDFWWAEGQSQEQIADSLKAMIQSA